MERWPGSQCNTMCFLLVFQAASFPGALLCVNQGMRLAFQRCPMNTNLDPMVVSSGHAWVTPTM